MKRIYFINFIITVVIISASCGSQSAVQPLDIEKTFIPCGFMGDDQNVNLDASCTENPNSAPSCIKISYEVGSNHWAGIYWSTKDCNWGDEPGFDLSKKGFTKITFWAKGLNGNESVQFKAGGMKDRKYKDSFDIEPKLSVNLSNEWQQFTIDLKGQDLSSVIGGFCWVANSNATLFLDDMRYE
jgi:hypothetical protein